MALAMRPGSTSGCGKVSAATDAARCTEYLCSDTLACVSEPNECPCPFAEQTRCVLGDGYVCTQTADCAAAEHLYRHP